jgi:hypothetical protein
VGKNPKLAPTYTGPGEIIDINDTNAKVKINNKIKILNVNKLKLFLQEHQSDEEQTFLEYNFNDAESDKPLTRARAKLINYKNAAQLALLMLKEEDGSSEHIDSLCSGPCPGCDSENDYFKLNPPKRNWTQKCNNCEEYKKLFLKLKECEEQCYQLKQQINFARQHRLHQVNQIKSVDTKLKTSIAESLREPLMKIAQHLLISDKNTFDQLTPEEKKLWSTFDTSDIYRFLTGEEDTYPEFQYNWTTVPKLQPLGPTHTLVSANPPATPPAPAPTPPTSSGSASSTTASSPHSSPTPSTSGTRPRQPSTPKAPIVKPDPSGASTSGTTPPAKTHFLRQRPKVDYKELNTGGTKFGRAEFRKRCSKAGASVRKSVAKVRKMSLAELFPPISRNSSSSSTASSK